MTTTIHSSSSINTADAVATIARQARRVAPRLASATRAVKDAALERIAVRLEQSAQEILHENAADVVEARAAMARGELSSALVDRLVLDAAKLRQIIASVRAVAALDDPVG